VVDILIRDKAVKRGYLGVSLIGSTLAELRDTPAKKLPDGRAIKLVLEDVPADMEGVLVNEVTEGTPAEEGGMKDFDIVTKIDGEKMTSSNELRNFVGRLAPGTTVKCTVWRDGKEIELSIKLGDREEGKKQVAKAEEADRPQGRQGMPWPWGGGGNGGNGPFEFRWPPQGGGDGGRMVPDDEPQENRGATLGIRVEPLTKPLAVKFGYPENLHGLVITQVTVGSVAQSSGLKEGDIIVEVNDSKIKPNEDGIERLKRFIREADFDDEGLNMLVRDKDGERKVEVKRRGKEL
jgi:S1-C subfamily serine protease